MSSLKELFLLDPNIAFLNHGSFGACPRPVFEIYQQWQRRLEEQPVKFIGRDLIGLLQEARRHLAYYLHTDPLDLVYVHNATFGVNVVARSLDLGPGDEVLATDHEYGACDRVWRFLSGRRGFRYVRRPVPLPVCAPAELVAQLWQGVTSRTRLIFVSHYTSATALRFPVEEICRRARAAGILTLIDGAHAPGHLTLDLAAIGADFYSGNCHKWLCSPKGAGFLYAHPACQSLLKPLVVSWGWEPENPGESTFIDSQEWLGTNDPAAFLAVPAAIQFQAQHDWPAVRRACHDLIGETLGRLSELTGLPPLYPADSDIFGQMAIAPLPPCDVAALKTRLYDEFAVEVPLFLWNELPLLRLSVQGYNDRADMDALLHGLGQLLPQTTVPPAAPRG